MKKQLWKVMGFLVALLAALPALGQANRGDVIANIPFAFNAGDQTLPAGRYIVTRANDADLRISDSQNRGVYVQTHSVEGKAPESKGRLVFHRYGDAYFLAEVWVAADRIGREVFRSRAEEALAARDTEKQFAVLWTAR